ncbi:MAG: hypothetical protein ABJL99_18695 [Aliishimia sp.]
MIRSVLSMICVCAAGVAIAQTDEATKEAECQFQGELVFAVQQARLERVKKDALAETLLAANPDWPAGVADAIPALGEYVYGIKRRDLKKVDLGESTKTQCLENWEQIQELKNAVSN